MTDIKVEPSDQRDSSLRFEGSFLVIYNFHMILIYSNYTFFMEIACNYLYSCYNYLNIKILNISRL